MAVTYAPGLIGAVLVGLSFAKSMAYGLGVPLIPVHHVRGHIAANYLAFPELEPPFLALAISGGNTLIVDVRDYTDLEILGATRDDAAGECFDKAARVLGLPYPGGAPMDKLAQQSKGGVYTLPHVPCGGGAAGHELFRSENGGGESGPSRRAGGRAAGRPGAGTGLCPGRQRYAGAPRHGGRTAVRAAPSLSPPAAWRPTPSSGRIWSGPAQKRAAGCTCRRCGGAATTAP